MPRFAAKVLDGARGPRADRIDEIRAQADAPSDVIEREIGRAAVDGTVYLSAFPRYMVQITAPADLTDPVTGRKTIGRPMKAQFGDGRYVNNARDPKVRAHIDEVMQSNSRFGKPGSGCDYWLAEEGIRMAKAAAKANATETLKTILKTNPEEFNALVAELTQGAETDIKMPAPPSASVGA